MGSFDEKSLVVVNAFSKVVIPKDVFESSQLHELVSNIQSDRKTVMSDVDRIESLRKEAAAGNFVSNLIKGRKGKLQEAQLDLNSSIGSLTERSAQLLVVNTAISKILMEQQETLTRQQKILEDQASSIQRQNKEIAEQQRALKEEQQKTAKNTDNLFRLNNTSSEQTEKLFEFVDRIEETEGRLERINQELTSALDKKVNESVAFCIGKLQEICDDFSGKYSSFASDLRGELKAGVHKLEAEVTAQASTAEQFRSALEQRHGAFEQQLTNAFSTQSQHAQAELERFASSTADFKTSVEQQLQATVADLDRRCEAFEQQLTSAFSTQSQHAQAELARFTSETAEFKTNIGLQLQAHIQIVLEKMVAQDAAAQQLRDALSARMNEIQQDMISTVEHKVLALSETVKNVDRKQEAVQQELAQALQAQRDSLASSVQRLEADLSDKAEALNRTEAQLTTIHAEQQKSASSNRLAFAAVGCLALASLGWQVAQHFALV